MVGCLFLKLLSQFNYLLSSLPSPGKNIINEIDNTIVSFIRSNRSAQKISKDMLKLHKYKGGLKVTLVHEHCLGLKISWITCLISNSQQGWKVLVNNSIPLDNNDFWLCNFNVSSVHAITSYYKNIPSFWRIMVVFFHPILKGN